MNNYRKMLAAFVPLLAAILQGLGIDLPADWTTWTVAALTPFLVWALPNTGS